MTMHFSDEVAPLLQKILHYQTELQSFLTYFSSPSFNFSSDQTRAHYQRLMHSYERFESELSNHSYDHSWHDFIEQLKALHQEAGVFVEQFSSGAEWRPRQHQKLHGRLTSLMNDNPVLTDYRISEFLSTPEAYLLLNSDSSKPLEPEQQRLLEQFLGGLLGIQWTHHVKASVKTEQLAQFIGYARSGWVAQDLKRWHEQPFLRQQFETVEVFLLDCVQQHQQSMRYHLLDQRDATECFLEQKRKNLFNHEPTLAPSYYLDVCFQNPHRDPPIFVMGGASSAYHDALLDQSFTLYKQYVGAKTHLKMNSEKQQHELSCFWMHGGWLPLHLSKDTPNDQIKGKQAELVVQFLKNKAHLDGHSKLAKEDHHLQALAKLPYVCLFQSKLAYEQEGLEFLMSVNPHIVGVSTLKEFQLLEDLKTQVPFDPQPLLAHLFKIVSEGLEAMAHPAMSLHQPDHASLKRQWISHLAEACHHLPELFECHPSRLSPAVHSAQQQVYHALHKLQQSLEEHPLGGEWLALKKQVNELERFYSPQEWPSFLQKNHNQCQSLKLKHKPLVSWSPKPHQDLLSAQREQKAILKMQQYESIPSKYSGAYGFDVQTLLTLAFKFQEDAKQSSISKEITGWLSWAESYLNHQSSPALIKTLFEAQKEQLQGIFKSPNQAFDPKTILRRWMELYHANPAHVPLDEKTAKRYLEQWSKAQSDLGLQSMSKLLLCGLQQKSKGLLTDEPTLHHAQWVQCFLDAAKHSQSPELHRVYTSARQIEEHIVAMHQPKKLKKAK